MYKSFSCFLFSPTFGVVWSLLIFSNSYGWEVVLHCGFVLHFLDSWCYWAPFHVSALLCLLVNCQAFTHYFHSINIWLMNDWISTRMTSVIVDHSFIRFQLPYINPADTPPAPSHYDISILPKTPKRRDQWGINLF